MVTIGDEGFGPLAGGDGSYPYTTTAGGYTWADNLNITTLDFGTFHLYPDSCKSILNIKQHTQVPSKSASTNAWGKKSRG